MPILDGNNCLISLGKESGGIFTYYKMEKILNCQNFKHTVHFLKNNVTIAGVECIIIVLGWITKIFTDLVYHTKRKK